MNQGRLHIDDVIDPPQVDALLPIHQQMHEVYVKSQIIRTRELSYMFQR
jgi:hypothetical protein